MSGQLHALLSLPPGTVAPLPRNEAEWAPEPV